MTDEAAADPLLAEINKRGLTPKADPLVAEMAKRGLSPPKDTPAPTGSAQTDLGAGQLQRLQGRIRGTAQGTVDYLKGHEKGIDYTRGAPLAAQIDFEQADNPEEAKAILSRHFGDENIGQDKAGRWWFKDKETGKKTAVNPSFLSGAIASAPATLGAIGGSVAGTAVGGPAGTIIGAAVGGAAGKGVTEFEKFLRGLVRKKPGEEAATIAKEGQMQAAFSAIPIFGKPLGQAFGQFVRSKSFGITPQSSERAGFLLEKDAIPPVVSVAREAGSLSKKQDLARQISYGGLFGSHDRNMAFVEREMRQHMQNAGIPDADIDEFMRNVALKKEAPSLTETGHSIVGSAQHYVSEMEGRVNADLDSARSALESAQAGFRQEARGASPHLAQGATTAMTAAREEFSQAMTQAYRRVHELTNGERIVDIRPAIEQAQQIVAEMQGNPNAVPDVIRRLAQGERSIPVGDPNQPYVPGFEAAPGPRPREWQDFESIEAAHGLRNSLRQQMRQKSLTLTPEQQYAMLSRVEGTVDEAFTELASGASPHSPVGQEAAQALRRTDRQYREGIAVFKNQLVNRLVADARDGIFADPSVVASAIFRPGQTQQARQLYTMLPPPMRDAASRAYLGNILRDATELDPFTGRSSLNGGRLLNFLNDNSNRALLNIAFNPQFQNQLRQTASEYAALNGHLDLAAVNPSSIREMLARANAEKRSLDEYVRENPIGRLSSNDPRVVEQAVREVAIPGAEAVTQSARDSLPPDVWQRVQQDNLRLLFSDLFKRHTADAVTISGKPLADRMAKYTERQRALLFPNGMGEDIQELAENIQFLFPSSYVAGGTRMQSGLAAGTIQQQLIRRLPSRLWFLGWDYFLRKPDTLRWLAGVARNSPNKEYLKAVFGATGRMIANSKLAGPGPEAPQSAAPQQPPVQRFDQMGNPLQ